MTEHGGERNKSPGAFTHHHHKLDEAPRLKRTERDDSSDDSASAVPHTTNRKRQRSRSRERARTGLWGDGQEQPGRNGMGNVRVSSPRPVPETRVISNDPSDVAPAPHAPSSSLLESIEKGGGTSSASLYLIEGEEIDDRELGHRMAFLSWRGYDEALLRVMHEIVYDDEDENVRDSPEDDFDFREADCRDGGRSSSVAGGEESYVPCDPMDVRKGVDDGEPEGVNQTIPDLLVCSS